MRTASKGIVAPNNQLAADIFSDAAAYIRTYGWQVAGMSKHGLPRCSMGALESAHQDTRWDDELATLMYGTLYKELDGLSLTEFNYKHRNGEAVALLFEKVAFKLRESEALVKV